MKHRSALGLSILSGLMGGVSLPMDGGVSYKNDSVAYRPKRTKFKGWQRQARGGK